MLQALNDDDDTGGDDMAVNMDGGKMDEFFQGPMLQNFFCPPMTRRQNKLGRSSLESV
jgi:hypothetical protein